MVYPLVNNIVSVSLLGMQIMNKTLIRMVSIRKKFILFIRTATELSKSSLKNIEKVIYSNTFLCTSGCALALIAVE